MNIADLKVGDKLTGNKNGYFDSCKATVTAIWYNPVKVEAKIDFDSLFPANMGKIIRVFEKDWDLDHFQTTANTIEISNNSSNKPINDHVCPVCKNDRCSKSEKNCWRCGSSLH